MPSESEIGEFLEARGISVVGEIIEDPHRPRFFLVFVKVVRDKDNRQIPSNIRLNTLKAEALDSGWQLEFLLTDAHSDDAEAGLRATLIHGFGDSVRNVFLSIKGKAAYVWLDQKRDIGEDLRNEIWLKASQFLSNVGLETQSVSALSGQNLPGKLVVLRSIRQLSPVSLQMLAGHLAERGFSVPSEDWLRRRLEVFRKAGEVVWIQGGKYGLSSYSLSKLGTSKNRNSPDLSRLLALAKGRL
jgi:hypothetical protein